MSPQEAARRFAEMERRHGDRVTDVCGTRWPCDALLLLREIRRVQPSLEAAERVTSLEHERDPVNCFSRCHWCDEFATTEGHRPDCPWQALVVALKGAVVP